MRCTFITVPNPSLSIVEGRYVICRRTPKQHPVKGKGHFVNHKVCLASKEPQP
jgi:hypothetical protein